MTQPRAHVFQGNGYSPSPQEIDAGSDGDLRLRVKGILGHRTTHPSPGTLWERVRESGETAL